MIVCALKGVVELQDPLKNDDFYSKSRRIWKCYRTHIGDMSGIRFSYATKILGKKTLFQGSLKCIGPDESIILLSSPKSSILNEPLD
jgi:hypothetical protein